MINAISMKATPELIVDPAVGHVFQRHGHTTQVIRLSRPCVVPEKHLQAHRIRKLRL